MKMLMRIFLLAALCGLLLNGGAEAADASGTYTTFGTGNITCERWLEDRKKDDAPKWQRQEWLLGYLSAYNNWVHRGQNVAEGRDDKSLFAWIDTYCREHTGDLLATATENLILNLKKPR